MSWHGIFYNALIVKTKLKWLWTILRGRSFAEIAGLFLNPVASTTHRNGEVSVTVLEIANQIEIALEI